MINQNRFISSLMLFFLLLVLNWGCFKKGVSHTEKSSENSERYVDSIIVNKVEPLEDIYFEAIFVTRLEESIVNQQIEVKVVQKIDSRAEIIENLQTLVNSNQPLVVYVVVALCDNESQGIIPVSPKLGNGNDPVHNLYWGARYGVKTWFKKSKNWRLVKTLSSLNENIIERCVFKRKNRSFYLIADAYRGSKIKYAVEDFLKTIAGNCSDEIEIKHDSIELKIDIGASQLITYVGHNGLMDFDLEEYPVADLNSMPRDVIILACYSRFFFKDSLAKMNVYPLLWTNDLLAPEAYTLEAAVEGWLNLENAEQIQTRASSAYSKYQKCSLKAANKLFVTGW